MRADWNGDKLRGFTSEYNNTVISMYKAHPLLRCNSPCTEGAPSLALQFTLFTGITGAGGIFEMMDTIKRLRLIVSIHLFFQNK